MMGAGRAAGRDADAGRDGHAGRDGGRDGADAAEPDAGHGVHAGDAAAMSEYNQAMQAHQNMQMMGMQRDAQGHPAGAMPPMAAKQ